MERTTYYYLNRSSKALFIDERENAIDSLETANEMLKRKDNLKWKWVSSALLHALYCFCIANLERGNYENVLTSTDSDEGGMIKKGDENWKKSVIRKRDGGSGYTIQWINVDENELEERTKVGTNRSISKNKRLLSFWSALARVQDGYGYMNQYSISSQLVLKESEWKSIEWLYYYVDKFIAYVPGSQAIMVKLFKEHCLNILPIIKYLAISTHNVIYIDDDEEDKHNSYKRLENVFKFLEENINKLNSNGNDQDIISQGFIEEITKKHEIDKKTQIELEIIKGGETEEVEFKSTMRYCMEENKQKDILEFEVIKTLAAFLNKKGGSLYIGVTDSGDIIGLENDYDTFRKQKNFDQFQKHLNNIFTKYFPKPLFSSFEIEKYTYERKEFCLIKVKKNITPVFIDHQDEKDILFVRSATSSNKLKSCSEIANYCIKNFSSYSNL